MKKAARNEVSRPALQRQNSNNVYSYLSRTTRCRGWDGTMSSTVPYGGQCEGLSQGMY
jgi:hypothetical protein